MRTLRLVVVASVGLFGLGACGSQQGAALFVGDERVAESTIDGYVDGIAELREEQGEDLATLDYSTDREQVVVFTLYTELGRELGLEKASTAGAQGEFDELYLEASGYYEAMLSQAEPRALTETEVEAIVTGAEADPSLASLTEQQAEQLAGFSDQLAGYVEEYDITVNPRYGDFDLSPVPGVFTVEVPQR